MGSGQLVNLRVLEYITGMKGLSNARLGKNLFIL